MKQFIRRIVLISGFLGFFLTTIIAFNYWRYKVFVSTHNSHTVVLGDSHAATGFDPDFFPYSSNFSQTAEPLTATAKKVKWIASYLKTDTILLILSPNNITGYNDFKFSSSKSSRQMSKRYFPLYGFKYWESLGNYRSSFWNWGREHILPRPSGKPSFLGSYQPKSGISKINCTETLARHFNTTDPVFSQASIKALSDIISTCNSHNMVLRVLRAPLTSEYSNFVPVDVQVAFEKLLLSLPMMHSSFSPSSALFYNCDHLNKTGAEIFTKALK